MATTFVYDDGGRAAACYKGDAGDCGTRAIAIAMGMPYQAAYDLVNQAAAAERPRARKGRRPGTMRKASRSGARTGIWMPTMQKIMAGLGWTWTPTMGIGTGCRVHLKADELPADRIIVRVSGHFAAVIDGVLHGYQRLQPGRHQMRLRLLGEGGAVMGRRPKLTQDQVDLIRVMYQRPGVSAEDLAKLFRVSAATILKAVR